MPNTKVAVTFERVYDLMQRRATQARDSLTETMEQVSTSASQGHLLTASTVERMFEEHYTVRSWNNVIRTVDEAVQTKSLSTLTLKLQEWATDATEQLLSPGRSHSTSLVRTAEMEAEEYGMKTVLRAVSQFISLVTAK